QELSLNEEKYRKLVNNMNEGLMQTDLDDKIEFVNSSLCKMLAYKPEELLGKIGYETIVFDEDRELIRTNNNRRSQSFEDRYIIRLRKKDGSPVWTQISGSSVKDKTGKVISTIGLITDITELKKTEIELQKQNQFIQTVLDNLPIGVALNEIDSSEATYMNNKFESIYGWSKDELKNIPQFFEKVYPDESYRQQIVSQVIEDIKTRDSNRMKWDNIIITTKDGSKRHINAVNIPLFEQNTMVSTVIDVSSQKKAEMELSKHKDKLEELVTKRTAELEEKNQELERMNDVFVGREFRIKELRDQVKDLENQLAEYMG
ncbi:MAG: PAS domain S-box protein, partial [Bacteroidetes bacterium]|nr:PAS domain S-box protein [Bacteroidota bacterium]